MTRIEQLKHALRILSAAPSDQVQYLRDLFQVTGPTDPHFNVDELVLQFSDVAASNDDMLREGEISAAQYEAVKKLDSFISILAHSEPDEYWTVGALRTNPQWAAIRAQAHNCLLLLEVGSDGEESFL